MTADQLRQIIADNHTHLLATIRLYVIRAGIDPADPVAAEVMSEVTQEALAHAERFAEVRHPVSWLLGIAANLIKRRITRTAKRERREPLVRDLFSSLEGELSDAELFDLITEQAAQGSSLETDEWINDLLAILMPDEQQLVKLAVLYDLKGETLAQELGIKPSTARMRLHRALRKLRAFHRRGGSESRPRLEIQRNDDP